METIALEEKVIQELKKDVMTTKCLFANCGENLIIPQLAYQQSISSGRDTQGTGYFVSKYGGCFCSSHHRDCYTDSE